MRTRIVIVLLGLIGAGCAGDSPAPLAPLAPSVELSTITSRPGYVRIEWQTHDSAGLRFGVERRHAEQPWKLRATLAPDPTGRLILEDATVSPGEPYTWRVRVPVGGVFQYQGTVTVEVPG